MCTLMQSAQLRASDSPLCSPIPRGLDGASPGKLALQFQTFVEITEIQLIKSRKRNFHNTDYKMLLPYKSDSQKRSDSRGL